MSLLFVNRTMVTTEDKTEVIEETTQTEIIEILETTEIPETGETMTNPDNKTTEETEITTEVNHTEAEIKTKTKTSGGRYGSNAQKTIVCWFCSKPGHIQTKCLARLNSNKPLNKSNNTVFTINGKGIIPENGITEEIIQKLTEAKIQGFNDESDFQ